MPSHIQRRTCRAAGLPQRLNRYKGRRPHGSLKSNTPSKLGLTEVRLLTYTWLALPPLTLHAASIEPEPFPVE